MRTVIFIDSVHPVLEEMLQANNFICKKYFKSTLEEMSPALEQAFGIVIRSRIPINQSFLEKSPNLKFIARSGSGLENIDLAECSKRNIQIFSSPEGNADAVGEHCMALLLALSNKIVLANNSVKNLEWNREAHRGFEIKAKTVGIIGYGNMGKAFAQRLTGFDCSVLAYDKYLKNYGNEFAIESSLTDIYRDADIVSLHLPLSAETWNYANDNFFNNFRKKIVFLNTARGNHVEINSLIRAIKSGKISHCGLDVLPFEKQSLEDINRNDELEELLSFPNVVVTPHVAGWTTESYEKLSRVLGEKILKAYS